MANVQNLLRLLTTALSVTVVGCVGEVGDLGEVGEVGQTSSPLFNGHGHGHGHKGKGHQCNKGDASPIFLDQGWDDATRDAFYQTPQGSRMLPYDWFLHLEQAGRRKPLRAASNMRRMGFLVDGPSDANPDGLPVGFARDVDPVNGDEFGLTCAACHTGELKYDGKRVRIDGGQSMSDIEQLQDAILSSLEATLANNGKFHRFASKLGVTDRPALRAKMEEERDWWAARISRSAGLTPHGPSRTDAFTIIGNELLCVLLPLPENCALPVAPTQFPFLWGTPNMDWAQYNSAAHSPIGRNVGEVTGVFAEASLDATGQIISSADLDNLHVLENWVKELQPPAWPEDILGEIDQALAAEGQALYATNCAACHAEVAPLSAPNAFGRQFDQVNFSTPLDALGTDPTAALSFATRRADPGPWLPLAEAYGLLGPDGKAPAPALIELADTLIIQRFFAVNAFTPAEQYEYLDYREPLSPTVAQLTTYKARPLHAVGFTGPYLHNGSVPSIYELLLPPEERSTQFYVGSTEFDPVDLGFSTEFEPGAVLLDTTQVGNGNGGHLYGTDLSDDERYALIEYLKTL